MFWRMPRRICESTGVSRSILMASGPCLLLNSVTDRSVGTAKSKKKTSRHVHVLVIRRLATMVVESS